MTSLRFANLSTRFGALSICVLGALAATGCKDKDAGESGEAGATSMDATTSTDDSTTAATADAEATSEASSEAETAGESSDSSSFVNTDMSSGCGAACDIWNENDCPEGEKCTSVACEVGSTSWDSNVCRPVEGTQSEGDSCTPSGTGIDGFDDCEAGLMCWDEDPETGLGVCVAFCIGSASAPDCALEEMICDITNDGTLPLCIPECDPLSINCPNTDNVCAPASESNGFACSANASGGTHGYGEPCDFINECNIGLLCEPAELTPAANCQDGGSGFCCTEICDLSEPNGCSGAGEGQECVAYYEAGMEPPTYQNVGICAIPGSLVQPGGETRKHVALPKAPRTQD